MLLSKYIIKGPQVVIGNFWNEDEASAIRATSFCSSIVILFALNSTRHGNGYSGIFHIISAFLAEGFFSHDTLSLTMEYRGFEPLSCTSLYQGLSTIETKCTPKNEKAGVSPVYTHSTINSPYFSPLQHNS